MHDGIEQNTVPGAFQITYVSGEIGSDICQSVIIDIFDFTAAVRDLTAQNSQ